MKAEKPKNKQKGIVVQNIGKETFLRSKEGKTIHILNSTAKRIWELCDGMHTVEDIEKKIRDEFSISGDSDIAGDILLTLKTLHEKGLLENPE